jgi:hypothetical protein
MAEPNESPRIKGPFPLKEMMACQQCPELISPGEEAFLIEPSGEESLDGLYVHRACLEAYLAEEAADA